MSISSKNISCFSKSMIIALVCTVGLNLRLTEENKILIIILDVVPIKLFLYLRETLSVLSNLYGLFNEFLTSRKLIRNNFFLYKSF